MKKLLSASEVATKLQKLPLEWSVVGGTVLTNHFEFNDFAEAHKFVNKVARLAELKQHHPDIKLSWGKVVIELTTHSENGLTTADFELAQSIEKNR